MASSSVLVETPSMLIEHAQALEGVFYSQKTEDCSQEIKRCLCCTSFPSRSGSVPLTVTISYHIKLCCANELTESYGRNPEAHFPSQTSYRNLLKTFSKRGWFLRWQEGRGNKTNVWGQVVFLWGFPGGASGKESTCQWRSHKRRRYYPWVRKISWRRKWQPNPVFLPGESCGQGNLVAHSPQGHKESDMT